MRKSDTDVTPKGVQGKQREWKPDFIARSQRPERSRRLAARLEYHALLPIALVSRTKPSRFNGRTLRKREPSYWRRSRFSAQSTARTL